MVYLPTFTIKKKQLDVDRYTIHGSYGFEIQNPTVHRHLQPPGAA